MKQMQVIKKRNQLSGTSDRGLLWRIRDLCTVLLISQFIFACVGKGLRNEDLSDAPFVVSEIIKQVSNPPIRLNKLNGLPISFTLNLKACITDRLRADLSILGTEFIIQYKTNFGTEDGKLTTNRERVSSDQDGCIQWTETYKYRFVRRSVWIGLKRDIIIVEDNAYTGKRKIPIAVNPWLPPESRDPRILDIRRFYKNKNKHILTDDEKFKPDGLNFLSKESDPLQLWAPVISLQAEITPSNKTPSSNHKCSEKVITDYMRNTLSEAKIKSIEEKNTECFKKLLKPFQTECESSDEEYCYRRYVTLDAIIPLKLRRHNVEGNLIEDDLTGGEYDVELQVVIKPSSENDKYYRLHDKICTKTLQFREVPRTQTKRYLNLTCDIKISHFNNSGTYQLLLAIKPSNGSGLPFNKFESVHDFEFNFTGQRNDHRIHNSMDPEYTQLAEGEEIDYISTLKVQSVYQNNTPFNLKAAVVKNTDGSHYEEVVSNIYTEVYYLEKEVDTIHQKMEFSKETEENSHENRSSLIDDFFVANADIESMNFKFAYVNNTRDCRKNENPVEREVLFIGEVCLQDTLSQGAGQRLRNIPVQIFIEKRDAPSDDESLSIEKYSDNGSQPRLDVKGCAKIIIPIRHKIYDRQKMYLYDIHIISESKNIYGKASGAFAPWQRAFQAFQNVTELDPDNLRLDTAGTDQPTMVIPNFRSVNLFHSFALNRLLNIHLFHRIYFLFQPFITRHDHLSFGLNRKALGGLRDGYYLVRLLLFRNPQETLNSGIRRVDFIEFIDSTDETKPQADDNKNPKYDLSTMEYITHTDMVVRTEANLVNLYAPIHISDRQLYYTGSRNLISIEVVPANPEGFVFHEIENGGECELNQAETEWWPYSLHKNGSKKSKTEDHELENHPFVGPFTISHWNNWNILRPARGFNSDKFIDRFEEGRKNRKFFLYAKDEEEVPGTEQELVQEQIQGQEQGHGQGQEQGHGQGQEQGHGHGQEQDIVQWTYSSPSPSLTSSPSSSEEMESLEEDSSPQITKAHYCSSSNYINFESASFPFEAYIIESCQENFSDKESPAETAQSVLRSSYEGNVSDPADILPKFAEANSLKLVELSSPTGEQFIEDIVKAGHLEFKDKEEWSYLSKDEIIPLLLTDEAKRLSDEIEEKCNVMDYIQESLRIGDFSPLLGYIKKLSLKEVRDHLIESLNQGVLKALKTDGNVTPHPPLSGGLYSVPLSGGLYSVPLSGGLQSGTIQLKKSETVYEPEISNQISISACEHEVLNDYIENLEQEMVHFTNIDAQVSDDADDFRTKRLGELEDMLEDIKNTESFKNSKLMYSMIDREYIINDIMDFSMRDIKHRDFKPFAHSLCRFWFDDYLSNYLGKEQMISAYTNFIRKFNYYQTLDLHSLTSAKKYAAFNDLMEEIGLNNREESSISPYFDDIGSVYSEEKSLPLCHKEYVGCIKSDYCLSDKADSGICHSSRSTEDSSCLAVLKAECDRNENFPFCKNDYGKESESCTKDMRNFCLINADRPICTQFASRCLQNYHSCISKEGSSDLFDLMKDSSAIQRECFLNQKEEDFLSWFTNNDETCGNLPKNNPLRSCLEDPFAFFKFERKMIVHELSKKKNQLKYEGGLVKNITVSNGYSIGSYRSWTADRTTSLTSHLRMSMLPVIGDLLKNLSPLLEFSQRINSGEGSSARRAGDAAVRAHVNLSVSEVLIEIGVEKFQKCWVVKPRPNAFIKSHSSAPWITNEFGENYHENLWTDTFKGRAYKQIAVSRPGLMLCGDLITEYPETIEEAYYYITNESSSQSDVGITFINTYDLANKPFVNVLRGKREFLKFFWMMRDASEGEEPTDMIAPPPDPLTDYSNPIEEARLLSLTLREFNGTNFYEGVYDYPNIGGQERTPGGQPNGLTTKLFEKARDITVHEVPRISQNPNPLDNRSP